MRLKVPSRQSKSWEEPSFASTTILLLFATASKAGPTALVLLLPGRKIFVCVSYFGFYPLSVFKIRLFSVVHQLAQQRIPVRGEYRENANRGGSLETTGQAATLLEGARLRREEMRTASSAAVSFCWSCELERSFCCCTY